MIGGAVVGTEAGAEAAAAAFNPSEEDPPEEVNEGAPAPSASVRPAPSAGAADVVRAEELGTGEGGDRPELAPPPARPSRRPSWSQLPPRKRLELRPASAEDSISAIAGLTER